VPIGALLTRKSIFDRSSHQMDRAVVARLAFGEKNDLGCGRHCPRSTVIRTKNWSSSRQARPELRPRAARMVPGYELLKEVRGKGLMIRHRIRSAEIACGSGLLERAERPPTRALFCQLITVRCSGSQDPHASLRHGSHTIKAAAAFDHHAQRRLRLIEKAFEHP